MNQEAQTDLSDRSETLPDPGVHAARESSGYDRLQTDKFIVGAIICLALPASDLLSHSLQEITLKQARAIAKYHRTWGQVSSEDKARVRQAVDAELRNQGIPCPNEALFTSRMASAVNGLVKRRG
jgi:hypothetical protein